MINYLSHHGIDGQKWGIKNGPPYPLSEGQVKKYQSQLKKAKSEKKHAERKRDEAMSDNAYLEFQYSYVQDPALFIKTRGNKTMYEVMAADNDKKYDKYDTIVKNADKTITEIEAILKENKKYTK